MDILKIMFLNNDQLDELQDRINMVRQLRLELAVRRDQLVLRDDDDGTGDIGHWAMNSDGLVWN